MDGKYYKNVFKRYYNISRCVQKDDDGSIILFVLIPSERFPNGY